MLQSDELPRDVQGAEEMIQAHQEIKVELSNKEQQFESLQNLGQTVASFAKNSDEVRDRMKQLSQEVANLKDKWEKRNKELKQSSDLQVMRIKQMNCLFSLLYLPIKQVYLRDAEELESVTASQEAFLANNDLGVCFLLVS